MKTYHEDGAEVLESGRNGNSLRGGRVGVHGKSPRPVQTTEKVRRLLVVREEFVLEQVAGFGTSGRIVTQERLDELVLEKRFGLDDKPWLTD